MFIPLYPKIPLFNVPGTFVAIRVEDFLVAVSVLVWAGHLLISGSLKYVFKDRVNRLLLLFWGIGALSIFSGIFLTQTTQPHLGILHYLRRIELMLLLPIAFTAIKNVRQLKICLIALAVVTVLVNIYALGQQYLQWPVISTGNSEFSKGQILYLTPGARANSTFAGHYDLAIFLSMVLVGVTTLFFTVNKYWKGIILTLSAVSFFVLILTAARQAFAATLIGVVVSLWLIKKRMIILLIIAIAAGALIYPSQLRDRLLSTITINIQKGGERYEPINTKNKNASFNIPTLKVATISAVPEATTSTDYIASDIAPGEPTDTTQLGVYRSFAIRMNYEWPAAIRAFTKNPFLGTGYSSLGLATDNDVLRSLGEVGLLGTLAFVLLLIEVTKRIWSNLKSTDKFLRFFSAGILAMVLAFIVNSLLIDAFEASKVASLFWLLVGITLAIRKDSFNHPE